MSSLTANQQRAVLFGLLDIHRRLDELEAALARADRHSPFDGMVMDLAPTERQVLRDYFARVRATMLALLHEAEIPLEVQRTSLRWRAQTGLMFVDVAIAELGPGKIRGYGPLSPAGEALLRKMQEDLRRLIDRATTYLRQGLGQDLPGRLARLDAALGGAADLTLLNEVVARWQLVEFRPQLDAIVRRLEEPRFEIAFFGRVSSGKSSLLNHLVQADVLPVGVTPVTAVPTRLARGASGPKGTPGPSATVAFAEIGPRQVPLDRLRDYASEEGNPGNRQHVTDILVRLPAARLPEGVVLVDTPGVGSLARSGGAEALAYLPRCDLGIILIDAASALAPDDLALIRTLVEGGAPVQVLISKADLLAPADRSRLSEYVREQVQKELRLDVPVHLVSTIGADEELLTRWFESELTPLLARHRELGAASVRRKIAHLRESVTAVLETLRERRHRGTGETGDDAATGRRILDEADAALREARELARDWALDETELVEAVFAEAARAVVAPDGADNSAAAAIRRALDRRGRAALELVAGLRQRLTAVLEQLNQAVPSAPGDPATVRDDPIAGLAEFDPSRWMAGDGATRPWWGALAPGLAVRALQRSLADRLGPQFREAVFAFDRQLQAWLKRAVARLTDLFEAQAAVVREQLRRLAGDGDGALAEARPDDLDNDLQRLNQSVEEKCREIHLPGTGQRLE